ncbi:hypothetical protein [Cellulomonas sp. ICMP 17802]|uniref:hypothetical protein n=1 Tax=Cellulomonas sp. ICMP 17802 TaxID=3239199 RepID=UPI00351BD03B
MLLRRLLAAFTLALALTGCSGAPTAPQQEPPATAEAGDVAPTKGSGEVEQPRETGEALPVLTTAVAGTGSAASVEAGTVCLFWTWGGPGTPQLAVGMSFTIAHAEVQPATWSPYPDACTGQSGRACIGAVITVDDTGCLVGFARDAGPTAEAGAHALVGMQGTFACVEPATTADCDDAATALGAAPDVSPDLDLESFPVTNGDG